MRIIKVKGIKIGEGSPKIIVPIVEKTKEGIIKKASSFIGLRIDLVEWRVDYYDEVFNTERVLDTLKELRAVLPDTPLLFTFRTKKEGGEKEISMEYYTALNKAVAEGGNVDIVDVEVFSGDQVVRENIENIHNSKTLVIASNHDFLKTPSKDDIIYRLRKMEDIGADISKIALMPTCTADVITVLDATNDMSTKYAENPIVTMSMGPLGVITRTAGEVFGSSMTFAAVGQVSAPGQIPVEELAKSLDILHKAIKSIETK